MIDSLSVVVPVYNEREGVDSSLVDLHREVSRCVSRSEIIVVDDGSADGTSSILAGIDHVTVLTHSSNRGYGAAVKTGIHHASDDWILITDGDASYPASNLGRLLEAEPGHDMVVGARPMATIHNPVVWNRAKVAFQGLVARGLGQPIPDINSGMRLFRRRLALDLEPVLGNGFSFSSGLTVGALRGGWSVAFTEIDYVERLGCSKVRPLNFTPAFLRSVARAYLGARRVAHRGSRPDGSEG